MTKMRLTIVLEYDVDPKYYDTEDALKMATIDQDNFNTNWDVLNDMLGDYEYTVKVEPV